MTLILQLNKDNMKKFYKITFTYESEEEYKENVEKLKAWRRLKNLGFSFDGAYLNNDSCLIKTKIDKPVTFDDAEQFYCDFKTLFGDIHESQF